jgi:hypothetical protein
MITNWPLVFFTVFSQFATGLALFSWWKDSHDENPSRRGWGFCALTAAIALASSVWCFDGLGSGLWMIAQAACAILVFCSYGCSKGASLLGIGAWLSGAVAVAMQVVDAIAKTRTGMQDRPIEEQKIASITVEVNGAALAELKKLPDPYGRF